MTICHSDPRDPPDPLAESTHQEDRQVSGCKLQLFNVMERPLGADVERAPCEQVKAVKRKHVSSSVPARIRFVFRHDPVRSVSAAVYPSLTCIGDDSRKKMRLPLPVLQDRACSLLHAGNVQRVPSQDQGW